MIQRRGTCPAPRARDGVGPQAIDEQDKNIWPSHRAAVSVQQSAFSQNKEIPDGCQFAKRGCMGNRFSLVHVQKLCNPEPCPVRPEPFAYAQDRLRVSEVEGHITVSAQDLDMSLFFFS